LSSNIKCGNSLIGPDFYEGRQMSLLDEEEIYRINAFDWHTEFPEIFKRKNPGFDGVIGNPPYLFITEVPQQFREYYQSHYKTVCYRFDLYGAFTESAHTRLLRNGGIFGFIIPHTLLSNDSFRKLRVVLATSVTLLQIADLGPGVFQNARNATMLIFFKNTRPDERATVEVIRTSPKVFPDNIERFSVLQRAWARRDGDSWLVHVSPEKLAVVDRMASSPQALRDLCTANQGLRTGNNREYLAPEPRGETWRRAAGGKHISRYGPISDELYVRYEPELLDAPRREEIFVSPEKIVVQEVRNIALERRLVATLDCRQTFCLQSTNVINSKPNCPFDLRYVLGVLNSRATNFFFRCRFPGNNHIPSNQLLQIPIPYAADPSHDRMVELVDHMLSLHREFASAKTAHQKTVLQRQIEATDRQIDGLVYELYGLTDEEIAIVEEATG